MKSILRERHKEGEKLPTRHYSSQQENTVAKNLDGQTTKNSGATLFQKGDITLDNLLLIECKTKTTHADSISIKKEWLLKNKNEALFMGKKYNTLAFSFGPNEENYYILDEVLFEEFINFLKTK